MYGLAALREEWNRLWQDLGQPSPYTSWTWSQAWMETHRIEHRLHILVAREKDGTLIGVAPLQRVPLPFPGLGVLTFIGQETSLSPDFLVQEGREREFCEAALHFIFGKRNLTGIFLKMAEPLAGATPLLDRSFARKFGDAVIEPYSERLIVQLPESYEVFLQTLSQKMRQRMRAARKKLSAEHTLEFRHEREEDFHHCLADLFSLNKLRWGQNAGPRRSLYPRLHEAGMLKVFSLYVNGRLAAALGALVTNNSMHAELAGFNYEVDDVHLGRGLYGLVIEWAILNGYRFFDFSSGTIEYKLHYKPQIFPKYRVSISRSAVGPLLLKTSRILGRHIRWWREPAIV